MSETRKIRVGICGLGAAALHLHLPACDAAQGQTEIVGACDISADARAGFVRAPVFEDLESLLRQAEPDVVIVATPPDCHENDCLTAIDAGCHVFCEKPLADDLETADRIVNAAKRRGVHVAVNNQFRWMIIHQAAKEMVGSDEFGDLRYVLMTQRFRTRAETEKGWRGRLEKRTCSEFGIHALDLMRYFFESEPLWIFAAMPRRSAGDPDLLNVIHLDFGDGRSGTVILDRLSRGPEHYLSVRLDGDYADVETSIGGELALELGMRTRIRRAYLNWRFALGGSARLYRGETHGRLLAREGVDPMRAATARLFREFIESLPGDRCPNAASDNRRSLKLVIAAYESARTGEPVGLSTGTRIPG